MVQQQIYKLKVIVNLVRQVNIVRAYILKHQQEIVAKAFIVFNWQLLRLLLVKVNYLEHAQFIIGVQLALEWVHLLYLGSIHKIYSLVLRQKLRFQKVNGQIQYPRRLLILQR